MDRHEWIDATGRKCEAVYGDEDRPSVLSASDFAAVEELLRLASDLEAKDAELEAVNAERVKGFAKLAALGEHLFTKDAELTSLKAENEALKEALRQIASFQEGPEITGSFDEPCSARIAREALSQSKTEAS